MLAGLLIGLLFVPGLTDAFAALNEGKAVWFVIRTTGVMAYLILSLSVVLGLLTSSRILMKWIALPLASELHKVSTFLALAALIIHVGMLLIDPTFPFTVTELFTPMLAPYRPIAVTAGLVSIYLSVLLTFSFYIRRRIGQKTWRVFHYTGFIAYLLATLHGLFAGTDSASLWAQAMYMSSALSVLLLVNLRIIGDRFVPTRRLTTQTTSRQPASRLASQ